MADIEQEEPTVDGIRERYAGVIALWVDRDPPFVPSVETLYYRAVLDIAWLLDHAESLEEYAHRRDLDHIGQRNELELLRTDNLQRRSEDVYYGRNRRR